MELNRRHEDFQSSQKDSGDATPRSALSRARSSRRWPTRRTGSSGRVYRKSMRAHFAPRGRRKTVHCTVSPCFSSKPGRVEGSEDLNALRFHAIIIGNKPGDLLQGGLEAPIIDNGRVTSGRRSPVVSRWETNHGPTGRKAGEQARSL